mmetsp:Transcript_48383/g.94545  ORF Transcript_48383/g.94545 Transcript_48383/m.94545 type:complete len:236 (-) Transcript_48383:249-956(-)
MPSRSCLDQHLTCLALRRMAGVSIIPVRSYSRYSKTMKTDLGISSFLSLLVTISLSFTMLGQFMAHNILISRIAVIGKPFSSCSILILFSATTSPVILSAPLYTLPYVPCPTWWFFLKLSFTSRIARGPKIPEATDKSMGAKAPPLPPRLEEDDDDGGNDFGGNGSALKRGFLSLFPRGGRDFFAAAPGGGGGGGGRFLAGGGGGRGRPGAGGRFLGGTAGCFFPGATVAALSFP